MEHLPPDDFSVDLINIGDFNLDLFFATDNYKSEEANVGNDSSKEIIKELGDEKEKLTKLIEEYKKSTLIEEKEKLRETIYSKTILLNEKQLELAQNIFLSNQSEISFLDDESNALKKVHQNSNSTQLDKADNLISEAFRLKIKGIEKLGSIDAGIPLVEQNKIFKEALEIQKLSIEKYIMANGMYKLEPQNLVKKVEAETAIVLPKDSIVADIVVIENTSEASKTEADIKGVSDSSNIETPILKDSEESPTAKKVKESIEKNSVNVSEKRKAEIQSLDERLSNEKQLESLSIPTNVLVENKYKNQPEIIRDIKDNDKYAGYFNLKIANDSLKNMGATQNKLMESFDKLGGIKAEQAKNIMNGSVSAIDAAKESDQLYNEAFFNFEKKEIAKINARKSDSLFAINQSKIELLNKNFSDAEKSTIKSIEENTYLPKKQVVILKTVNSDLQPEITPDIEPIRKEKIEPILVKVESKNVTTTIDSKLHKETEVSKLESKLVPKILVASIFAIDTISKNRATSIVQNPTLPNGLVYMVQVGAFKNEIKANTFNDFSPVLTDKLNNGITRYIVGLFIEIYAANDAKNQIRAMGYKDAFVVAYQDGKRIQMVSTESTGNSAIAENIESKKIPFAENKNSEPKKDTIANEKETKIIQIPKVTEIQIDEKFVPDNKAASYYNDATAAKAKQVEIIKGLFYTVQVGVYSKPVSINKLFNITPLNSELLSNGFIRYTSGQFISLALASAKKDNIVNAGITDAFITAYYNGKRISVTQAQNFVTTYGNTILTSDGNVAPLDSKAADVEIQVPKEKIIFSVKDTSGTSPAQVSPIEKESKVPSGFGNSLDDGNTNESVINERVEYKVLLGQFDENIPSDVASALLNIQYLGVNMEPKENGAILYTSNTVYFYKSASDMLKSFKEGGMKDAKIIAFIDKMPATVEEARELSGQ